MTSLAKFARAAGALITVASASAQVSPVAQRAALEKRVVLLICDVHLAEEAGREVCRRLKRHEQFAEAGLIFLSASQSVDIVRRSFGRESVYFLRQPVDSQLLLELVDRALWMPHSARQRVTV